jgi:ribosomal-protein-alanine N-acetyltransferase
MIKDLVLETDRLRIRPYVIEDLDEIASILGDPVTMRYYPHPFSRAEARAWIERNLARYEEDGFGLFAIDDRATGEFLGNCGPVRQVVEGVPEVELGWHVKRSWWGRGIATEAAVAWRDHSFGPLGRERLISLILPRNLPSRRVAEKIGMTVKRTGMHAGQPHLIYALARPPG